MAILAAVIATPVVIAAAFTLLSLWQLVTTGTWSPWLAAGAWLVVAALATPATLVVMVLVAAPLARRLRRQGRTGLVPFVRLGVMLAVLPLTPLLFLTELQVAVKWATLAAFCGAGSAAAYWAVSRPR